MNRPHSSRVDVSLVILFLVTAWTRTLAEAAKTQWGDAVAASEFESAVNRVVASLLEAVPLQSLHGPLKPNASPPTWWSIEFLPGSDSCVILNFVPGEHYYTASYVYDGPPTYTYECEAHYKSPSRAQNGFAEVTRLLVASTHWGRYELAHGEAADRRPPRGNEAVSSALFFPTAQSQPAEALRDVYIDVTQQKDNRVRVTFFRTPMAQVVKRGKVAVGAGAVPGNIGTAPTSAPAANEGKKEIVVKVGVESPTWVDPTTKLVWTTEEAPTFPRQPLSAGEAPPRGFAWEDAGKYCRDLRLSEQSDWRLPTIDELTAIYDSSSGKQVKIRGPFNLWFSSTVWSATLPVSSKTNVRAAWLGCFTLNCSLPPLHQITAEVSIKGYFGTLCVRGPAANQ